MLADADLLSGTPTLTPLPSLAPLPSLLPGSSTTSASVPVPVVGPTNLGLPIPPVLPPVTAPSPLCSLTNSCPATSPNDPGTNPSPRPGTGGTSATSPSGFSTTGVAGTVPGSSSPTGGVPSALDRAATLAAAGLDITPPPPVVQLSPLAGISFGRAPYLWPMFLLLDLVAAGVVVLVVRRTWSTTGAD